MEGIKSRVVCMALVVLACMSHGSLAQTTHVVGDALGWLVPPGGDTVYRTWAASQTFIVGDILVFNYMTGTHDVAEVRREAHDSCNSTSPVAMYTDGPTSITLTSAGEHHFICTFGRHCDLGQRLSINVSALSPSPSTTPQPTPAPTPSVGPTTHVVGDSIGWTVPPGGPIAYQTWAMGTRFMVGDILVFNFPTGIHDVAEVTSAEYSSCNTSTNDIITTGPARIRLTSAGEHYYICTIPRHCSLGQQLAINVTGDNSIAMPPSNSNGPTMQPTGPSTLPTPPSNSAPSFVVAALPFTFLAIALVFLYT